MNTRLVVVPHADHSHLVEGPKVQEDGVAATRGEWCEPEMHVILGAIDAINQISDHTGVLAVGGENVDVWRVSTDVSRLYWLSAGTEHFKAVETNIMTVAPGGQDVDDQSLALRQHRDLKIIIPLHGWIIIWALTQRTRSTQGGKRAPGCCH